MAEYVDKTCKLEVDFLNCMVLDTSNVITLDDGNKIPNSAQKYDKEVLTRFLESLDVFWHDEKDQLQYLSFYSDNTLFCQRKKYKYDFANGQQVYSTYTFTGFTEEQVSDLYDKVLAFIDAHAVVKEIKVNKYVTKVDENILFFEKTYLKRVGEKNAILAATDWRILPDVVDSYPGEKDRWIFYRQKVRSLVIPSLEDHPTPLDFFKAIKTLRWPMDPKNFRDLYPDGVNVDGDVVEYLATDNQWVERETDSSRDLIESRLSNIIAMRQDYAKAERTTTTAVKEMMKLLRIEDFVEGGIDYNKIYTQEELNDMAE